MPPQYQPLYQHMTHDIERCLGLELPEKEKTESCFWIASHYWDQLKMQRKGKEFSDEAEEIEFFKKVKPAFTSWMEYFILLSEALLFVPASRPDEIIYWEGECERFRRFCNKNNQIVQYLESKNETLDAAFFLRKNAEELSYVPGAPVYDVEPEFCTSHDGLVKSYLAQKRFYEYAIRRIELLKV